MKLYDESILGLSAFLKDRNPTSLPVSADCTDWPDVGERNMILRGDMAYELGGGNCAAISSLSITSREDFVPKDEILLYGPDLTQIKQDTSYARITLIRVKEDGLGEGNALYNAIRKIEYVRYHFNPKGYMMRISSSSGREPVRIGKEALEEGLNFQKIGNMFVKAYHENPNVEAVKIIFVTLPDFSYKELGEHARKNEQITAAIDHIFKNVMTDCKACSLKEICDEVEGMKELHFGTAKEAKQE